MPITSFLVKLLAETQNAPKANDDRGWIQFGTTAHALFTFNIQRPTSNGGALPRRHEGNEEGRMKKAELNMAALCRGAATRGWVKMAHWCSFGFFVLCG